MNRKLLYIGILVAMTGLVILVTKSRIEALGTPFNAFKAAQLSITEHEVFQQAETDTIPVSAVRDDGITRGPRPPVDFLSIPDSLLEKGHLLVKFHEAAEPFLDAVKPGNLLTGIRDFDALNKKWGVKAIICDYDTILYKKEFAARHRKWGLHLWYQIDFPEGTDIKQAMLAYRELSQWIDIAEPEIKIAGNYIIPAETGAVVTEPVSFNDPMYSSQWNYHNTGQSGGQQDADIDLPEAWAYETGKKNVIVAILDSGVDTTHTDLRANMWVGQNGEKFGYNFYSTTPVINAGNHGTHVAGIIGAVNDNNDRISGIAGGNGSEGSGVMLMSCQVSNPNGSSFSSRAIKRAFIWSADRGAAIAQNSWGTLPPNTYNTEAMEGIDYFIENGGGNVLDKGIVIFSAGNSNLNAKIFPAAYERVTAVAATSHTDARASYSSYGSWVDISAPGGEGSASGRILSTYPMAVNNGTGYLNGTSMASPHVSGVAALIVSRAQGKLSSDDVRSVLLHESDNHYSQNPSFTGLLGKGRLNAHNALVRTEAIMQMPEISGIENFSAQFLSCNSVQLSWSNPEGAQVVIAKSTEYKGLIGYPAQAYAAGDPVAGGGEVIYVGNGTGFSFDVTEFFSYVGFKIWRYQNGQYSKGSFALVSEVYPCSPAVLYVKQGGSGDGSSWTSASGDLQKMIDIAAPGSAVYVAKGTYKPAYIGGDIDHPAVADRNNFFLLSKRVRLLGGFPDNNNNAGLNDRNPEAYPTILSGDFNGNDDVNIPSTFAENSYHVLATVDTREPAAISLIDGFTISGGNANGTGGISVRGIPITNNLGGGWFNAGGVFNVANLKILNNTAGNGGGWYNLSGSCYLTNVEIKDNKAVNGGGWYNVASNPVLYKCVIEGNTATGGAGEGGGWYNYNDSPSVFNSKVINNSGIRGGGIYCRTGYPLVFGSLLAGNNATVEGGALYQYSGILTFQNLTIADNSAAQNGGGIYSRGIANSLTINNSLIWGNEAVTGAQIHLTNTNIMVLNYGIVQDRTPDPVNFVFNLNPEFVSPDTQNYRLSACSPAVNKGNNILIAGLNNALDLDALPRFFNSQVDLGAYEFQQIPEPSSLSGNEISVQLPVFNGSTVLNDGCDFIAGIAGVSASDGNLFAASAKLENANLINHNGWHFVKRYFEIEPSLNAGSLYARVTLYFKKEEFDLYNQHYGNEKGLSLPQHLKVVQFHGTPVEGSAFTYSGNEEIITPNINDIVLDEVSGIWKVTFNVNGFSGFFVTGQSAPESLPVTLVNFNGKKRDDHTVDLNWQTTDEHNFKLFELERSAITLQEFRTIGEISAREGNGLKSYSFQDMMPYLIGFSNPPVLYYRLKMIDHDGTYAYSKWISVETDPQGDNDLLVLYPNPSADYINIRSNRSVLSFVVEIFDSAGNKMGYFPDGKYDTIQLNHLPAGQYLIKFSGNGWQETRKIVKK